MPSNRTIRYKSYKGEISSEVDNIINRDLRADSQNSKWLTDRTEFATPVGKLYLSLVIDCFDGMVVCWNVSTTSDSILVNKMLDEAISTLSPSEHPIVHTDSGCYYR